jgi:2-methylcitrate dehydratase
MSQAMTQSVPTYLGEKARLAVERIASFAAAARPEQLTPAVRQLYKRNILDSLGCAIAALPGPPFRALREQFEEYRALGRCTLIAGRLPMRISEANSSVPSHLNKGSR